MNAVEHHLSLFRIKTRSRFVEDQYGWVMNYRLCEAKLLSHPGRIGFNSSVTFLRHPAEIQDLMSTAQGFNGGNSRKLCDELHAVDTRHSMQIAIIFGHVSDMCTDLAVLSTEFILQQPTAAACRLDQSKQYLDECRLASAIWSKKAKDLSILQVEC
mgnify:CR=1 FL=1